MYIENAFDLRKIDCREAWTSFEEIIHSFFYPFLFIFYPFSRIGKIYNEFLSQGKTINFGKYYNQLDKLKNTIAKKRSKLANWRDYHNNAKTHVALTVRKVVTIWLRYSIASFHSYSSDPTLSDYYLFLLLKKILSMINNSNP